VIRHRSVSVFGAPLGEEVRASFRVDGDLVVVDVGAAVSDENGTACWSQVVSADGKAATGRFKPGSFVWVPLWELDLGGEP
jgi:hypothetical protein